MYDGWTPDVDNPAPLWTGSGPPQGRSTQPVFTPNERVVIHRLSPAHPQLGGERKGQRGGKGAADLAMRVLRAVYSYGIAVYDDVLADKPIYEEDRRQSFLA